MNLLETYSHFVGVKPLAPYIYEEYYPIPFDKYIVIQAGAGMPSKQYDMWEYVLENVKVKKIQLGGKDDEKLNVDLNLCGNTNFNQTAYILRHSSLFLGCDSVCNHIASAFGVPRIALFGPTSPLTCGGVYDRSRGIEIVPPNMQGCKAPCHNTRCLKPEKCLNSIKPETVLENVKIFLGQDSIIPVEILHVGRFAKTPLIEWLPKSSGQTEFDILRRFVGAVNVRLNNFNGNFKALSNICNLLNLKYILITPPCQIHELSIHPSKVEQVFVQITKENVKEGIETMKTLASNMYKTRLLSNLPSSEFNSFKLDIMDFPPIETLREDQPKVDNLVGKCYNIKTARKILAQDNKFFLTVYDAKNDQNAIDLNSDNGNINIQEEHLKESAYFAIKKYEKV